MVPWYWRGYLVIVGNTLELDKSTVLGSRSSLILNAERNVDTKEVIDFREFLIKSGIQDFNT